MERAMSRDGGEMRYAEPALNRHRFGRRGFTLIELLVVIAIIALLAAILFPVFATAREKARVASCASNEKQIGLALIQYAQDYDETFPCDYGSGTPGNNYASDYGYGWSYEIYPYLKSGAIFACPDDSFNLGSGNPKVVAGDSNISYGANFNLIQYGPDAVNSNKYAKLASLSAAASTVLVYEVANIDGWTAGVVSQDPVGDGAPNFLVPPVTTVSPYGYPCCQLTLSSYNDAYFVGSYGFGEYATGTIGEWTNGTVGAPFTNGTVIATLPSNNGMRHINGSNFLAADGHVKFLAGTHVSGGIAATSANNAEKLSGTIYYAAGTGSMTLGNGGTVALTFSPM